MIRRAESVTAISVTLACLTCVALPAAAEIHLVEPDGSGDFPTIQAAVDAAMGGDVIELGDGVFEGPGNRDVDFSGKAVTVRSLNGAPELCVLECGGSQSNPHRGFIFQSGEGAESVLEDITISNAYHYETSTPLSGGAGVFCDGSSPTIVGCEFVSNVVEGSVVTCGGHILCTGSSVPVITGCAFTNGTAGEFNGGNGGAIACMSGADVTILDTTIDGNYSGSMGGGIYVSGADASVIDCTISDNGSTAGAGLYLEAGSFVLDGCSFLWNESTGDGVGGALCAADGSFEITSCTFMGNLATVSGGGIHFGDSATGSLANSIVSYSIIGEGIYAEAGSRAVPAVHCCNVFENAGGNYGGAISDQTGTNYNISSTPKFCDAPGGDVSIYDDSPCAAENSPCGYLIGSADIGCFADPVESSSWGEIKSSFE